MTDHEAAITVTLVPGTKFEYALRCSCGYIATGTRVTAVQQGIVDHLRYTAYADDVERVTPRQLVEGR